MLSQKTTEVLCVFQNVLKFECALECPSVIVETQIPGSAFSVSDTVGLQCRNCVSNNLYHIARVTDSEMRCEKQMLQDSPSRLSLDVRVALLCYICNLQFLQSEKGENVNHFYKCIEYSTTAVTQAVHQQFLNVKMIQIS